MKKQKRIALASILAALCVVILLIGSLFQTLDLSAAALSSIAVMLAVTELGTGMSLGVYLVGAFLSVLLLPQKSAAIVFAIFLGYYPILKVYLNRIRPLWLSVCVRLAVFNAVAVSGYFAATRIFGAEIELPYMEILLLVMANIVFGVYDIALERLAVAYLTRIRPKIFGKR